MWANVLRRCLAVVGIIQRPDLAARIMNRHPNPEELPPGTVVIVKDGRVEKWACLRCPGGCGEKLMLSLNQARRPRWSVSLDWLCRPSITPSINQLNACGCHFWIKDGAVEWCRDSRRSSVSGCE
ncbi:hypothetical protein CA223_18985 [Sphingomonas koreensis]|uniref:Uncharacterized protein n=2 Tax=Sphingomonas koreensis TaxID=93064 RepID=A0A1L6J5C6_9SPHN|nr:hypothetical protein BRX40_00755 [Sphingomonas koreensis]RSU22006.1 hypothetical protein CA222_18875 [Sphingomonas koreensis]RSU31721.1 hypothetical protein BRX39_17140 [Sphingomonas koreensis]RSU34863.1 hypothetical protein CA223_18985 [Sphingomonas koreensis]RSU37911.1 hypothetical protein BRX38_16270 [Sphingomonas koreensis]